MSDIGFCQAPWSGLVVHFSGAVFVCDSMTQSSHMQNMLLGNVHNQSLIDIWHGAKLHSLRNQVSQGLIHGLICEDCDKLGTCNLYGDPQFGQAFKSPVSQSLSGVGFNRLELGLTDLCNMKCTMCCLSRGEASPHFLPQKGMMDIQIAKQVIADACELSEGPLNILLHWVGEPLIHPNILELLDWMKNFDLMLNLVTNGIKLSASIFEALHKLRHPPCINISLNAFSKEKYQQINQVNTMALVQQNIHQLLEFRQQHNWQSTIIASSVVLAENALEMPDFVRYWQSVFVKYGDVEVGLNGRGTGHFQIQLLCELDRVESAFFFRQVQRWCNIDIFAEELAFFAVVDARIAQADPKITAFFEENASLSILDEPIEALIAFLRFDFWSKTEISEILLKRSDLWEHIDGKVLETWVFEHQWTFEQIFESSFFPSKHALLWLFLCPNWLHQSQSVDLLNHRFTQKEVRYLTQMMLLDREKARKILGILSTKSTQSLQRNASDAAIIALGLGKSITIQHQLENWHWRAICILLAQQVDENLQIDLKIQPPATLYGAMVAAIANRGTLDDICSYVDDRVEDWFLRFLRRWTLRNGLRSIYDWNLPNRLEGQLLQITLSVLPQIEEEMIAKLLHYCRKNPVPSHLPQDLAEISLAKPHLLRNLQWDNLSKLLWQQSRCPLLQKEDSHILGSAVFRSQFLWSTSDQDWLLQHLHPQDLHPWHLEQIQELKDMLSFN